MSGPFKLTSDTKATLVIDVGNKLNFKLAFQDGSYRTSPDPVKTTGIGSIKLGSYDFSGITSYASAQGGLDQTTACEAIITSNTVTISFADSAGNPVATFQGNSSELLPGSKYKGNGSCNWVKSQNGAADSSVSASGGGRFSSQSDTKAKLMIAVGNKLDFSLVFTDTSYKTSPDPVKTTGIGAVQSGTYEFSGTTSYASKQGGLDQATGCNVVVTSNTVTISFHDTASNPVATFQGNSSTLPPGSKYNGDGSSNWVKN